MLTAEQRALIREARDSAARERLNLRRHHYDPIDPEDIGEPSHNTGFTSAEMRFPHWRRRDRMEWLAKKRFTMPAFYGNDRKRDDGADLGVEKVPH